MNIGSYEVKVLSKNTVQVGCQTVTYQQVLAVRDLMDRYVEPQTFKVGDFVKVVKTPSTDTGAELFVGKYGKVVIIVTGSSMPYQVEFAEPVDKIVKHTTGCGHNWWCSADSLQLADDAKPAVESKFKIGDRVRSTFGYTCGKLATVRDVMKDEVLIQFDGYDGTVYYSNALVEHAD